jgi:hypothetical protein
MAEGFMLRKRKVKIVTLIALCLVVFLIATLTVPTLKGIVKKTLRKTGLPQAGKRTLQKIGLLAPPVYHAPRTTRPILPPDRVSVRRHIVTALHKALTRNDFKQASFLNSILSQEAFQRAYHALKAWEKARDPITGMVPRGITPKMRYWNAKDTAADLFPFLLLACQYLDKNNTKLWLEMLEKEREICGPMPCTIRFGPTMVEAENLSDAVFGASEYAKDGLLPLAERFGHGPWFTRMEEIMQSLIEVAQIRTKFGSICSSLCEINGEMLQVLTRLYWTTRKEEYLEFAERIAEAYLFEVLPNNGYLPSDNWDFSNAQLTSPCFCLRDHGSEIIAGLTELYILEKALGRAQAVRYRNPLNKCLDLLLIVGRTGDGLWCNTIDTANQQPLDRRVMDTWGYILNGYQMFDLAEGTHLYSAEIKRGMLAAAARKSFRWEGRYQDGYADAIESMLYLLPWFNIPECHYWVDDEIEVMFGKQFPSGFVEEWYLDGNFIRTSLLYATYKTQGIVVDPWRQDVCIGAAQNRSKGEIYIHLSVNKRWEGSLKFDLPRHSAFWSLPFEYPRLNATPEWFTVEPQKKYILINTNTGERSSLSGKTLADGLPIILSEEGRLFLKVIEE